MASLSLPLKNELVEHSNKKVGLWSHRELLCAGSFPVGIVAQVVAGLRMFQSLDSAVRTALLGLMRPVLHVSCTSHTCSPTWIEPLPPCAPMHP